MCLQSKHDSKRRILQQNNKKNKCSSLYAADFVCVFLCVHELMIHARDRCATIKYIDFI